MTGATVTATAHLPGDGDRATELHVGRFDLAADDPTARGAEPAAPTALGLLTASLATCTAMSVRTHLERTRADPGDVDVEVRAEGEPVSLVRTVTVTGGLTDLERNGLGVVIDRTPVTRMLAPGVPIRSTVAVRPARD